MTATHTSLPPVVVEPPVEELLVDDYEFVPDPEPEERSSRVIWTLCIVTLVSTVLAGGQLADREGWLSVPDLLPRIAALLASWGAIALLARRCGGRYVIIGGFAAVVLALVGSFPEEWALAGAAVAGASAFGVLGMVLTRPARGVRVIGELVVSAFVGLCGAVVVTGYDVDLRPYRFRVMVLGLVLVGAFALAWRLGHGRQEPGPAWCGADRVRCGGARRVGRLRPGDPLVGLAGRG